LSRATGSRRVETSGGTAANWALSRKKGAAPPQVGVEPATWVAWIARKCVNYSVRQGGTEVAPSHPVLSLRSFLALAVVPLGCSTATPTASLHAAEASACVAGQFRCADATCLPATSVCNGLVECGDASDENRCAASCQNNEFRCDDGACIDNQAVCDGATDCLGGADESRCANSQRMCPAGTVSCGNRLCVPAAQICDGVSQCGDGSDEAGCSQNSVPVSPTLECPSHAPHRCSEGLYHCTLDPTLVSCFIPGGGASLCPPDAPFACSLEGPFDCSPFPSGVGCGVPNRDRCPDSAPYQCPPGSAYDCTYDPFGFHC